MIEGADMGGRYNVSKHQRLDVDDVVAVLPRVLNHRFQAFAI